MSVSWHSSTRLVNLSYVCRTPSSLYFSLYAYWKRYPTIDTNKLSSNISGIRTRQPSNSARHFPRRPLPLDMRIIHQLLIDRTTLHAHLRGNRTGCNNIHRNALGAELFGEGDGHRGHCSFRRCVRGQHFVPAACDDGADVDDAAAVFHVRDCGLDEQEGRADVNVVDGVPRIDLDVGNAWMNGGGTGVIDDDIDGLCVEGFECLVVWLCQRCLVRTIRKARFLLLRPE